MKKINLALAAMASMAVSVTAAAQSVTPSVDTTEILAYMNDEMITALAAVGGVVILASVVAISFKWIKGMLFG